MKKAVLFAIAVLSVAIFTGFNCQVKGNVKMQKNAVLIDVRSAEEFSSGHLQGAVNIPHMEIAEKISGVAAAKNTPLYLYCRSGRRVGLAMEVLQKLGYTVMFNLGGYEEAKKFIETAHKYNLKVIVDLPSCGSYDLSLKKPDWFTTNKRGEAVIPADWTDIRLFKIYNSNKTLYKPTYENFVSFIDKMQSLSKSQLHFFIEIETSILRFI